MEILRKKRNGEKLNKEEIEFLIKGYINGTIPDYQFSAFLMAVYFRGMDFEETAILTEAMLSSGKMLDLSDIKKPKIDKHSTGGVGDKVSIILIPLVASCGVCVPMISGRGLGHTGGTLDKLESVSNFKTDLSIKEFINQLKKIGAGFIGQTEEIAPADRMIYALRDVTATVDSIPLISASIMSKKLAEDLNGLVLDVKFGSGAFMRDYKKAKELAHFMVQIGKKSGVRTIAVLTDMDNPLGEYIGNALEIIESIEGLKGNGPRDLMEVVFTLGEMMLKIAGIKSGRNLLLEKLNNKEALNKFKEIIENQGGDIRVIEDYSRLPVAKQCTTYYSPKTGYIHNVDTFKLGSFATILGAGRLKKEDHIDPGCGFRVYKKIGDYVLKNEPLIDVYSDNKEKTCEVMKLLPTVFQIKKNIKKRKKLIREIIY